MIKVDVKNQSDKYLDPEGVHDKSIKISNYDLCFQKYYAGFRNFHLPNSFLVCFNPNLIFSRVRIHKLGSCGSPSSLTLSNIMSVFSLPLNH
jgi:hypothetical protein